MNFEFYLLTFLVMCANVVEAITGFGSTIIAVTIGAHLYRIDDLVIALVPLNIVISVYIVVRHWVATDIKELISSILPFAGIGLLIGLYIFSTVKIDQLKIAYGVFVFGFSVFELVRLLTAKKDAPVKQINFPQSAIWLISGGIMQGIYASGGPLVVYYASRKLPNKTIFRSTLSGLWLILNAVMFAIHLATGKATVETLKLSGMLLPALVVGIIIGEKIHKWIPEKVFRLFVFVLLIIAGGSLFVVDLFKWVNAFAFS